MKLVTVRLRTHPLNVSPATAQLIEDMQAIEDYVEARLRERTFAEMQAMMKNWPEEEE